MDQTKYPTTAACKINHIKHAHLRQLCSRGYVFPTYPGRKGKKICLLVVGPHVRDSNTETGHCGWVGQADGN